VAAEQKPQVALATRERLEGGAPEAPPVDAAQLKLPPLQADASAVEQMEEQTT